MELESVIIGGLIGITGGLLKDFMIRQWEKEKWLMDHEVKECAECIDLLWTSKPPYTAEYLEATGWDAEDFNGRMQSLQHVPAKMAMLILHQARRGDNTAGLKGARKHLVEQINLVRREEDPEDDPEDEGKKTKKPQELPARIDKAKKTKKPHELPARIDEAIREVENYWSRIETLQKEWADRWTEKLRRRLFG